VTVRFPIRQTAVAPLTPNLRPTPTPLTPRKQITAISLRYDTYFCFRQICDEFCRSPAPTELFAAFPPEFATRHRRMLRVSHARGVSVGHCARPGCRNRRPIRLTCLRRGVWRRARVSLRPRGAGPAPRLGRTQELHMLVEPREYDSAHAPFAAKRVDNAASNGKPFRNQLSKTVKLSRQIFAREAREVASLQTITSVIRCVGCTFWVTWKISSHWRSCAGGGSRRRQPAGCPSGRGAGKTAAPSTGSTCGGGGWDAPGWGCRRPGRRSGGRWVSNRRGSPSWSSRQPVQVPTLRSHFITNHCAA